MDSIELDICSYALQSGEATSGTVSLFWSFNKKFPFVSNPTLRVDMILCSAGDNCLVFLIMFHDTARRQTDGQLDRQLVPQQVDNRPLLAAC